MGVPLKENEPVTGKLDPNIVQRMASNPLEFIWVGASAGTGKTKVLTDRVLRLLLPRIDDSAGTPPNRILCLTFTKAAANEMALRINKTLGQWAVMDIDHSDPKKSLRATLSNLLGQVPSALQLSQAQQLFANVVDCSGGLQIMTIHSFCQSVLGRFPLEADLPPNFTILDDAKSMALMQLAQNKVLEQAQHSEFTGSPLASALYTLAHSLDEQSFTALIQDICKERHQLSLIFDRYKTADGIYAAICDHYDIPQNAMPIGVIEDLCAEGHFDAIELRAAAEALMQDKGKTAPQFGAGIIKWLNADFDARIDGYDAYESIFLKKDGDLRVQAFPPKSAQYFTDTLREEAKRLMEGQDRIKRIHSAIMTRDFLVFGHAVLVRYTALKQEQGVLDFDDLVIRTMELLNGKTESFSRLSDKDFGNITPWIMYKLDQGLDHILIDEAQDTNPEQWCIIEALCEEFFSGMSARDEVVRTSFTVGDVKQSIYSFQRAAPEEFQRMQGVFDQKIKETGYVNRNIALDISFRSTSSVLRVVDAVFKEPVLNSAVGGGVIHHQSFRAGQAGLVELWPCFESPKKEARDFWDPPVILTSQHSGAAQLAAYTAQNIRNWLDRKEILEAYGRPIEAGDIMILVRSRNAFVDQLIRALKVNNIPVSGADRMVLGQQLAVQDLLALARFCLLPEDDLTLACVLKSPFLGWDEEELFSVSYNRKGTLWQELCNFDDQKLKTITGHDEPIICVDDVKREQTRDYLARLMGRARYLGAYEFFSLILMQSCPADDRSGLRAVRGRLGDDALDPIEELMNVALAFGRDNIDHLQLFLEYQEHAEIEIKREMDEQGGHVRIMTIHGSKGLQAPIVIMPDTIKTSAAKKGGRFLWPSKTGKNIPLYAPRKDDEPKIYRDIYQHCNELDEQEYYRLLYVAMTRAADRLYIAGYKGSKAAQEGSWYMSIKSAMEREDDCVTLENGHLCIRNNQTANPDKIRDVKVRTIEDHHVPDWAFHGAPEEPSPRRPLIPSRPSDADRDAVISPLSALEGNRFRRGNLTHKLLQFLPDFAEDKRRNVALQFLHKNAKDITLSLQENIVSEVLNILQNPEYAPFFQSGSMAEVSVTGLMEDNRIVSGQIDRLVVTETDIWIIDYKTNRPSPRDVKDVPAIYRKQLAAYRDSIEKIYPNRRIHCALLWTDEPRLMVL